MNYEGGIVVRGIENVKLSIGKLIIIKVIVVGEL